MQNSHDGQSVGMQQVKDQDIVEVLDEPLAQARQFWGCMSREHINLGDYIRRVLVAGSASPKCSEIGLEEELRRKIAECSYLLFLLINNVFYQ